MMPSLFLAHGSPMLAIQDTDYTSFLKHLEKHINRKQLLFSLLTGKVKY